MDERIKMIGAWMGGDYAVSELAAEYGVSRKTAYKWIERYGQGGPEALRDRSRAPHHHPNAVTPEVERALLDLKARRPLWGAPKLRRKLELTLGADHCPAESTVSEILRRHGLSRIARRRRRATPSEQPFAACQEANAVWCADFKGWFRTGDGNKCTPLTISDGHSRYLLRCQGLDGTTGFTTVKPLFVATFREYGLPRAIRTDNGPPFASTALGGLSPLSVWWVRLGLNVERIEPGCPQQNGRHERMHRTLKAATAQPPRASARRRKFTSLRRVITRSACRRRAVIPTTGKNARCVPVAKSNGKAATSRSPKPSSARKSASSRWVKDNGPSTSSILNWAASTNAPPASNPTHA